jgi:hypothetical protein
VAARILLDSARVGEGGVHAAGQNQFSVNYEVEYTCMYKTEQCLTFHPIGMRIQSGCPIRTGTVPFFLPVPAGEFLNKKIKIPVFGNPYSF